MTQEQGQLMQQEMFTGVQVGLDQFIQSDLAAVFGGVLSIALFMFAYTIIMRIISSVRENVSEEKQSKGYWSDYGKSVKEEEVIREEVTEYNVLESKINAASHAGDSGRVAIYKKRQAVVVSSGSKKLSRLHFGAPTGKR
ncbi:MAG: hypothetical protein NDI73_00030 [Desulfuromonadales bacterium]|nr:hypothetical protein [Desulfuromonadales bacterium]